MDEETAESRQLRASALRNVEAILASRQRAEQALRGSEERLRAMFQQAAVGIAVADLDGRFEEANDKFCAIVGYPIEELVKLRFIDFTHPDDVAMTNSEVRRLLAGEIEQYIIEKRYVRKDGVTVWSKTTVSLLRQENGEASQFIGIIEDISERRQADGISARLAAVIENSDDAIITKTLDSVITSWNPGARQIFGYTAEEMIGKPVTLLIPDNQLDEEPAIIERLRNGERIEHYETTRRRKNGELINVSLSVSPLKNSAGQIVGASKIARDITRRKRAEQALREQAQVLELLDATGRSIASKLDLEKVLQTVTDIATQLSGAKFGAFFYNITDERGGSYLLYTLSGAPREAFEKFGMPRNTPIFNATFTGAGIVRSADITKDPRYGQMPPHHGMPNGHLPVRSYLAAPVISRAGEVLGGLFFGHPEPNMFAERAEQLVAGVAAQAAIAMDNARLYEAAQREIEQRHRAEAALRETDQRKDEFLATLAHELRNPLAPIRQAALLSNTPGTTEAQKRWSHEVISRQVQHMSLLLDDLLDISRITRGTLSLRLATTELSTIVDSAVETARPSLDGKNHALTIELPPVPVQFSADPLRMSQVLSNLLTNAAKYTDAGGRITLRGSADRENIEITVTDTGIGISPEAMPGIFTMFSQIKSAQDRSEGGLGIGLALAKGIVSLHGGTLTAQSAGAGRGSEFTLRIPRRTLLRDAAIPAVAQTRPATVRRRVLIADDNRDAGESLALLLRSEGHEVSVVHDGHQAAASIEASPPDVALLDIGMPRLDGYEVARIVRQKCGADAPILIAVTGWGQENDKVRALAAGFNLHFTKPVEPERLIEILGSETLGT